MSSEPLYLTEVRRLPDLRKLRLTWSDGHSAELDYDLLRGYCPCATCQGHGALKIAFHRPPQPVTPVDIDEVGNYAISIGWSDRHSSGIYRFDFLRDLAAAPPPEEPEEAANIRRP